ncbi:unnamed protein product [Effrenium voratum]|nr:unnamed protein product [Effrenium voratum]
MRGCLEFAAGHSAVPSVAQLGAGGVGAFAKDDPDDVRADRSPVAKLLGILLLGCNVVLSFVPMCQALQWHASSCHVDCRLIEHAADCTFGGVIEQVLEGNKAGLLCGS